MQKETTRLRNRDFIRLCQSIVRRKLSEGQRADINEVVREALATPPRAHYIEYDHAVKMLRIIDRIGMRRFAAEGKCREKWIELSDQVAEAMSSPRRLPFGSAVAYVLAFCRPGRYYISETTARRLLRSHLATTLMPWPERV